jgi:hypothetical protein
MTEPGRRPDEAFPPRSAVRGPGERILGGLLDAVLDLRQLAIGTGRVLDREAAGAPVRRVLVLGVYLPDGAGHMATAVNRLRSSRHRLTFALGAAGKPDPDLADITSLAGLEAGKFANLNRLAATAQPLANDWIVLLDDDVAFGPGFLDRMLIVAERLGFAMAQPALRRSSHTAWEVTRRRSGLARRTRFVEIGPVLLLNRDIYRALSPFPEEGMGWGLDVHWGAVAEKEGWRLGVVDAAPVAHDARPTGSEYSHTEALDAATNFLANRDHLSYERAEEVLESFSELP